jgi:hypothetical protein
VFPQRDNPLEERTLTRARDDASHRPGRDLSRKQAGEVHRRRGHSSAQSSYSRNTGLLQCSGMGLLRKHELTSFKSLQQMSAGPR